jgi:hypothetical protein
MKNLKLAALSIALAAATVNQASAGVFDFTNWGFNPLGTGIGGAITPIDEMTYLGTSWTNSPTGFTSGSSFTDDGRFYATGFANGGAGVPGGPGVNPGDYEITATYLGWAGTYGATTGGNTAFSFTPDSGILNLYIDTPPNYSSFATASDGTPIMSLEIVNGGGNINFGNVGGVDGNVNILFRVASAAAGYWFVDTDNNGTADTDITALSTMGLLTLAMTDSNNNILTSTEITDGGLIADFSTVLGYNPLQNPLSGDIFTFNDGSAQIGAVPEPEIIGLLSLGLMGLGATFRRRAK